MIIINTSRFVDDEDDKIRQRKKYSIKVLNKIILSLGSGGWCVGSPVGIKPAFIGTQDSGHFFLRVNK